MLSEDLAQCITALKWGFYRCLLRGEIKDAQSAAAFLQRAIIQLHGKIAEIADLFEAADLDKANAFAATWNSFLALFAECQSRVKQHVEALTPEEFQSDPNTWRGLLTEEFKKPVNDLVDALSALSSLTKDLEKGTKSIILAPFAYSPKYENLKNTVRLYLENKEIIDRVEKKIRLYVAQKRLFVHGVTGRILTGKWKDYFHAYLPMPLGNHRIVYSWDNKTVVFTTIGTHQELGLT